MIRAVESVVKVMFIPPFWCGVADTIIAEIAAVVIAAICMTKK